MKIPFSNFFRKEQYPLLGVLAAILANFSSRLDIVYGKKLMESLSPMFISLISMIVCTVILVGYMEFSNHFKRFIKLPGKQILAMTASTILSAVLGPVLFLEGLKFTTGTNATLLINLSPLFLCVLAVLFLHEKMSKKLVFGTIITCVGIAYLATNGFSEKLAFTPGDMMIITAALCYGISNTVFKKYIHEDHVDILLAYRSIIGMVILFLSVLIFSPQDFQNISHVKDLAPEIAMYTLFTVLITYILHYWSLEHVKIQTLSLIMLTGPIIGVGYAIVFLHEKLTAIHIVSALIIVGGIGLCKLHIGNPFLKIKNKLRHFHNGV